MRTLLLILIAVGAWAQNTGMTARQLYLDDSQAVPAKPAANQLKKPAPKEATRQAGPDAKRTNITSTPTPPLNSPTTAPNVPVALHLGMRYNILAVDRQTGSAREVDPNLNFKSGDCLAIRLTPNRSGFLYLFNAGTSGAWTPLLPSPKMTEESNRISARENTKFPKDYCFGVNDPPGTDRLVVVLTERPEDQQNLSDAIRSTLQKDSDRDIATHPAPSPVGKLVLAMITAPTDGSSLSSRDLSIETVALGTSGEPPHSVYVVKVASQSTDRIVFEIKIRHE
jgi:hypothetical protein